MALHGEDTGAKKSAFREEQADRKPAPVSFGFTKTVSKFKPATGSTPTAKDEKDYLVGIDSNELQRYRH